MSSSDLIKKINFVDETRNTLQHFSSHEWLFPATNHDSLMGTLTDDDRRLFPCSLVDFTSDDMLTASEHAWRCLRKYVLKEDVDDLTKARKHLQL